MSIANVTNELNTRAKDGVGLQIGTASADKIAFHDATPCDQSAAPTTALTTITHTAPGTPDYAIQNFTQSSPFGFVTADEANSVLAVVANLQARVSEVEACLQEKGLMAS